MTSEGQNSSLQSSHRREHSSGNHLTEKPRRNQHNAKTKQGNERPKKPKQKPNTKQNKRKQKKTKTEKIAALDTPYRHTPRSSQP
jgi:hypothetical protein